MKHLESYKPPGVNDPKEGDYVCMNRYPEEYDGIGKIIHDVSSDMASFRTYEVDFNGEVTGVWDNEIEYFSSDLEDVEAYIHSKKYNL